MSDLIYIPLKNPSIIAALIVIMFFGWHVRKRFFETAARSRPLRLSVVIVNGTCLAIMIAVAIWHYLAKP